MKLVKSGNLLFKYHEILSAKRKTPFREQTPETTPYATAITRCVLRRGEGEPK